MPNRNKDGTFAKGTSGNPAGRPKRSDAERYMLNEICKLAPQAVESLKSILMDEEVQASIRLKAVEIVLNRVCGTALDSDRLEDYEDKIRLDGFGNFSAKDITNVLYESLK